MGKLDRIRDKNYSVMRSMMAGHKMSKNERERFCIQAILDVEAILGHTPTKMEWQELHMSPSATILAQTFGSWSKALVAAGLKPNKPMVTSEAIIKDIQRVGKELGYAPYFREYAAIGRFTQPPIYKRFGSWPAALRAAGLEPRDPPPPPNKIDTEDLIEEMQRVADLVDGPLTIEAFREYANYGTTAYETRFGSWTKTLSAAGLDPFTKRRVSDDEIINTIQLVADGLGRSPAQTEFAAISKMSVTTVIEHFGSWTEGLIAAGLEPNQRMFSAQTRAKDGHICDSILEAQVDNWLYEHGIRHEVHVRLVKDRRLTCDFVINDLWIEIDGLGDQRPDGSADLLGEKIRIAKSIGRSLIVIPGHSWRETMSRILSIV